MLWTFLFRDYVKVSKIIFFLLLRGGGVNHNFVYGIITGFLTISIIILDINKHCGNYLIICDNHDKVMLRRNKQNGLPFREKYVNNNTFNVLRWAFYY